LVSSSVRGLMVYRFDKMKTVLVLSGLRLEM
jgi:hypothetical protein